MRFRLVCKRRRRTPAAIKISRAWNWLTPRLIEPINHLPRLSPREVVCEESVKLRSPPGLLQCHCRELRISGKMTNDKFSMISSQFSLGDSVAICRVALYVARQTNPPSQ
jgi:hypothetical protein